MRISTVSIIFRAYFSRKSHTKNVSDEESQRSRKGSFLDRWNYDVEIYP